MINNRLSMTNIVEYKDKLYFLAFSTNSIYEMNKDMSSCRVITRLTQNGIGVMRGDLPQYEGIYIYNHKIIVLPDIVEKIVIYDFNDGSIRYLEYPESEYKYTPFCGGVFHGKYMYILPCRHNTIIKVDMESECIKEVAQNDINIGSGESECGWGSIVNLNRKIVFTSIELKKIFEFKIDSETIRNVTPVELHEELAGIVFWNDRYFVAPKKCDRLVELNEKFEVISSHYIDIKGYFPGNWSFAKLQIIDSHIYMLPRSANMFIRYDLETECFEVINMNIRTTNDNNLDKYMPISNVWKNNGITYFAHSSSGKIFKIINDDIEECHIDVDNKFKVSYAGMLVYENKEFDRLPDFLNWIIKY